MTQPTKAVRPHYHSSYLYGGLGGAGDVVGEWGGGLDLHHGHQADGKAHDARHRHAEPEEPRYQLVAAVSDHLRQDAQSTETIVKSYVLAQCFHSHNCL